MQAATYYVSTSGSDSNSGTASAPFLTVSKGVSAAHNPGDTVIVMNGTYTNNGVVAPSYVVTLNYSGTSGNPITIMAQNRGQAILDSGNTATGTTCNGASAYFNLNSQAFVVIQGFVIQNACDAGFESNASEHDITLRWNTIQYIANHEVTDEYGRDGIYLNSNEYNFTLDGNVFHDIGRTSGVSQMHFDHGIYSAATSMTIINNVFYNMTRGWSITVDGGSNWLIANNTFAFPDTPDGEAGQIMMWNPVANITIENNIFYEPNTSALTQYAATMTGCTFTDNLIYGASSVMSGGSTTGMTIGTNQIGPNPSFVNATTAPYNFALNAGSPAIGVGLSLPAVTDDINGTARPATPSLGAYQSAPAGPVLSNVSVSSITSNSAYITWTTSDAANSSVQYGTTGLTSSTATNTSMVTMHSVEVTGLSASTAYQFRASSTDASGLLGVSTTSTFTTAAAPVIPTSFSLSAGAPSVSIAQGQSTTEQITASLLTGTPASVSLTASQVSGLTTSLASSSCTLPCSSSLAISAASTLSPGTYTLTITGSGSGLTASVNIAVTLTAAVPAAPPAGPTTTGLVADWALNAASGTVAVDSSGNGNTGTVNNGYWWDSAHGPSLWFDGSSSWVTVNESASLEETTALTVAFWLEPNANSNHDPRIVSKNYDWDVKLNGANRYPEIESGSTYAILDYSLTMGTWYHVVFTLSSGVVKGYVNGAAVSFSANTFPTGFTLPQWKYGLFLGTDSTQTNGFIGSLAGVRIYNQALSAAQVSALYASGQ